MARCKNRRAGVCPSCSRLYAGDTWHLVHAGIAGDGHEFPAAAGRHPIVFATLTAPSFGPVHGTAGTCGSGTPGSPCPHGRPHACGSPHGPNDPVVGQPLCPECYDYVGHVLFTWHAPQLWHRFTVQLRRLVTRRSRDLGEDPTRLRTSYVKVVEFQRRAIPHFHAVVRLDAAGAPGEPFARPATNLDCTDLAGVIHRAAAVSHLVVAVDGTALTLRFGPQVDTRPLVAAVQGEEADPNPGGQPAIAGRRVAAYLAKYVTKSVVDLGVSARRLHPGMIDELEVSEHVRQILRTITELARQSDRRDMANWLHTLGFRGHTTTKTRRYSTTMGALRAQRDGWRRQQRQAGASGPETAGPTSEPTEWEYVSCGLSNDGERLLAVSAAERHSEMRKAAREELADRPESS